MEKLQVNINILQSQVDESEAKYDILEAMLQKPEKTWTEEERIQFVNKKSLREAEEKLQDILTSARQKLIDMHSEKLKLLQRASAAQVSKNVGRKAAPKGINTSPTGRTQGATRPAGDSDSFQSPSEPLNGYRDRERENSFNAIKKLKEKEKKAARRSKEIDTQLQHESKTMKEAEKNTIKMILLGPADSGKSTFLKQLRLLFSDGFSSNERDQFTKIIRTNIFNSLHVIIEAMEQRKISFDPEISPMVNIVSQGYSMNASMEEISRIESIADAIKKVLESSQVKGLIRCANEINLQDTAPYYFENIDRIFKIDYTPTDKDVIYSRSATTAISETSFKVGQRDLLLIDVGGQKSLRLQWAPYFEQKLSCIIFVAAISSYDQVMAEDCTVNRMKDTLSLFKKISENKLLKDVAIIVFLNKTDLFKAKLETSPINLHFSEYTGDQQYKNARKFFRRRFEKITDSIVNESGGDSSRNVYYHDTTNTDPKLVSFVFKAVSDIVLNMNLKGINFAQDRDSYGGSSS